MSYQRQSTSIRNGAKGHNLADFKFFYNTPFTDYNNTVHFKDNKTRDDYFLNKGHFEAINFDKRPFNFIRDRNEVNVPISWQEAQGINYCTFISDFESRRYYAFINAIEYVNDEVVTMHLVIDTIMTFTQGNILSTLPNIHVLRQHLSQSEYNDMLPELRNNDDVLKAGNKYYIANYHEDFGINYVMFQSSADLRKEFGDKKEPNLETSQGITYDNITSPVDIYVMEYNKFNKFMDKMSKYAWITQNFQKIQLIPQKFINENSLEEVKTEEDIDGLMTLKTNQHSKRWTLDNLEVPFNDLLKLVDINKPHYKHLLRSEYFTIELYSWDGDSLLLDAGKLPEDTGVKLNTRSIIGYHNEVRVYPVHYNSGEVEQPVRNQDGKILIDLGSFLNKAMKFDSFAEVPILIDNGILQQSQQAYQQKNAEDKLISNRAKNIVDPNSSPKSKFYDATSIASNLSPYQLFSKFNEEYDYYRDKKAEYKDLALQKPNVTPSKMGNAFQIANDINGLTLKIGVPTPTEMLEIMKYYQMFGFDIDAHGTSLSDIDSMTICNYVQIKGTYSLDYMDNMLLEQMKALLEQGVRFWHDNGEKNPMAQNPMNNTFRK